MRVPARLLLAAALLLTATACQADPPNDKAKLTVFDTEPRQRMVLADPGRLTPMTPADIRRSLMTCLQSPPYPPDAGPMCLRANDIWVGYSGWGNSQGRYTIVGNEVRVQERLVRGVQRLAFYRNADGRIYLRYLDTPERPPEPIEPYDESDFLNGW